MRRRPTRSWRAYVAFIRSNPPRASLVIGQIGTGLAYSFGAGLVVCRCFGMSQGCVLVFWTCAAAVTRVRLLPVDPFPNLKLIGEVKCRVLMIHGTADRVVPFSQGQALFKLANEPKRFVAVEGGGHNSLPDGLGGEEYLKLIKGLADGDDLAAKNAESARDVL